MASCFCRNLCARDHCLLAQGAFSVPPTISALWRKERRASTNAKWTKTGGMPRSSSSNERFTQPPTPTHPPPRLNLWDAEGNAWPSCWQSQRGLHLNKLEGEGLEWFTSLRSSSRRACPSLQLFAETSRFASTLSSVSSTCSRSGREGKVSDMTSSEVSMSGTAGDWGGTNAEEGDTCSTHASQSAMKCNLAPIGLGLQGASTDLSLQNNREGEMGKGWGMRRV